MKRCRAILVLLLSLWLPYSASAGLSQDLHCHHDGLGVLLDAPPSHHHYDHHHQAADPGCDCPVKCGCQHHCAAGAAPLALHTPGIHLPARMEAAAGPHPPYVAAVYPASLLRPPTAPTGAA